MLTPTQRQQVLDAFAQCPLPLYLRLAYNESRRWTSYSPAVDTSLPPTLPGLIGVFMNRLIRVHGQRLVEHACMYIAVARDGVSFSELEDLLSLDDDVLNDVFQYWYAAFCVPPP